MRVVSVSVPVLFRLLSDADRTSVTNENGTTHEPSTRTKYTYDSFGNLTVSTGSITNAFRYTGREWDSETSLYYYRARYYDPAIGRFISEDPTGFRAGANFYPYVSGNPLTFNDPTGLDNRSERCKALKKKIEDIDKDIAKRLRELEEDKDSLPDSCPGDIDKPRLSKQGHRRIIRALKTDKLVALVQYLILCPPENPPVPPIPVPIPVPQSSRRYSPAPAPGETSAVTGIVIGVLGFLGLLIASGDAP